MRATIMLAMVLAASGCASLPALRPAAAPIAVVHVERDRGSREEQVAAFWRESRAEAARNRAVFITPFDQPRATAPDALSDFFPDPNDDPKLRDLRISASQPKVPIAVVRR